MEVNMADHSRHDRPSGGGGYSRWVFWGFLVVAAYFLIAEHGGHGKDDREGGG
jgi:hypothetical protein